MLYANTKDCSSDKRVKNLAYFLVLITTRKSSGKPTTVSSGKLPENIVKSSPRLKDQRNQIKKHRERLIRQRQKQPINEKNANGMI